MLMSASRLNDAQRAFVGAMRIARLATADAAGVPHVIPVCYALVGDDFYVTIDEKPKQAGIRAMKRLRNIDENPNVAVVVDRYHDDDWSRLAWVMLRGRAEILDDGDEHDRAQAALRERYAQYRAMRLEPLPVIALRIARVSAWGALVATDGGSAGGAGSVPQSPRVPRG
ncbi:MAG: TIGR03668 family PPOX class F420-dependent oxidoreductase [Thiotrichales bacterium]|nr:TIGR03668 family PPOX class F420-dependent oxidoreductase [Thiotrichales bacterium]